MSIVESSSVCPITITDGTIASQLAVKFYLPLNQRIPFALALVCEYLIKIQDPAGITNYADLALAARTIGINTDSWALALNDLICGDTSVTATCSDQVLLNRIWTIFPVAAYKVTTIPYPPSTL